MVVHVVMQVPADPTTEVSGLWSQSLDLYRDAVVAATGGRTADSRQIYNDELGDN